MEKLRKEDRYISCKVTSECLDLVKSGNAAYCAVSLPTSYLSLVSSSNSNSVKFNNYCVKYVDNVSYLLYVIHSNP